MNLVKEIVYPNNGKRMLNPTTADGQRQAAELAAYKLTGMLPPGIDAIANGMPLYGASWTNSAWARSGPRKTWQSSFAVTVVVPARNADGSYKTVPFTAGSGFDFTLWNRAQADFYNSAYGQFFPELPLLEAKSYDQWNAIDTNYAVGPCADYPLATYDSKMKPEKALRFDSFGDLKIFDMAEFRAANPIVGEQSHVIPVQLQMPEEMLLQEILRAGENVAVPVRMRLDAIRTMLGAPIPAGRTV